jgi:hypothetical protein
MTEEFNPLVAMKELTAQLDDAPDEDRHLYPLAMEALWKRAETTYRLSAEVFDNDDLVDFILSNPSEEARHVASCELCLDGVRQFMIFSSENK